MLLAGQVENCPILPHLAPGRGELSAVTGKTLPHHELSRVPGSFCPFPSAFSSLLGPGCGWQLTGTACAALAAPQHLTVCSAPSVAAAVKIEEPVAMEMDNHMAEKEDSCYDNAEAAFSDDEEELSSKGEECSQLGTSAPQWSAAPPLCQWVLRGTSPSCWRISWNLLETQFLQSPLLSSSQIPSLRSRFPAVGCVEDNVVLLPCP